MRSFFIETWGCQMNHHDSERLEGQLRRHGLEPAPGPESADLVLLNTCSVRDRPVRKIASRIGELGRRCPPPLVGVCGCVAEQEGQALLDRSPLVRFVLGPGQVAQLGEALRAVARGDRLILTGFAPAPRLDGSEPVRRSPTRGMITVVEGCDEFCTFCIVPYTRGRERSRTMDEILDEARGLVATGVREVELLGQTINAYRCPASAATFAELLDAVADVPGLDRIRYVTSHPRHFDDRLIGVLARRPAVSRYLHLPVQSGSDRVLQRMHRRYTRAEYLDLVSRIRSAVPDINLSTDVIVGFPGETEADVAATLELVEQVRFGQVFGFAFSPRPRTPAARYPGQVPEPVRKERLQRLFALTDRISLELNQSLVGTVARVLIDGSSRRDTEVWQGRGEDNRVVNFPRTGREGIGDVVEVRIRHGAAHSLRGEAVAAAATQLPVLPPA
ncbi:MAG TPA: tRNA (N6-isopentenyl adenosine(37)-C2)-methylthiotransferase MiaB [Thermoanaerobaculales bacterium]|nr:tRNA (N6-isopentenyl adenosine(37)-C2)-methylthiotransferase MiaB [Thermoanaerobaculales bacterium]HQN97046.1 tRNA (N6-isopentenyl adenosine(37)-C2)-methylthiotransferase MiaB [Thermoanaerobaculales bacterium]HQP44817.1 tRNA (N6-isopentenyl adenosine(37)-C2)-methylthiotransferase MiaB [Thermoanaerobaculales bacterium]